MAKTELDNATILQLAELCDGWSILSPQVMIDRGLPESIAKELTEVFKSDRSSIKTTLYVGDKEVDELTGIYSLRLLAYLADLVGVPTEEVQAYGRGTTADRYNREIVRMIGAGDTRARERIPSEE
jgi:hypothetical protein